MMQRELDAKCCSASNLRIKFYRTIVQLHKPKSIGQSNARSAFARSEEKLKNLPAVFRQNPRACIRNRNFRRIGQPPQSHREPSASRHGLASVEHKIQHGLLDETPIQFHWRK